MHRRLRRFLSSALALVCCLGSLPVQAGSYDNRQLEDQVIFFGETDRAQDRTRILREKKSAGMKLRVLCQVKEGCHRYDLIQALRHGIVALRQDTQPSSVPSMGNQTYINFLRPKPWVTLSEQERASSQAQWDYFLTNIETLYTPLEPENTERLAKVDPRFDNQLYLHTFGAFTLDDWRDYLQRMVGALRERETDVANKRNMIRYGGTLAILELKKDSPLNHQLWEQVDRSWEGERMDKSAGTTFSVPAGTTGSVTSRTTEGKEKEHSTTTENSRDFSVDLSPLPVGHGFFSVLQMDVTQRHSTTHTDRVLDQSTTGQTQRTDMNASEFGTNDYPMQQAYYRKYWFFSLQNSEQTKGILRGLAKKLQFPIIVGNTSRAWEDHNSVLSSWLPTGQRTAPVAIEFKIEDNILERKADARNITSHTSAGAQGYTKDTANTAKPWESVRSHPLIATFDDFPRDIESNLFTYYNLVRLGGDFRLDHMAGPRPAIGEQAVVYDSTQPPARFWIERAGMNELEDKSVGISFGDQFYLHTPASQRVSETGVEKPAPHLTCSPTKNELIWSTQGDSKQVLFSFAPPPQKGLENGEQAVLPVTNTEVGTYLLRARCYTPKPGHKHSVREVVMPFQLQRHVDQEPLPSPTPLDPKGKQEEAERQEAFADATTNSSWGSSQDSVD